MHVNCYTVLQTIRMIGFSLKNIAKIDEDAIILTPMENWLVLTRRYRKIETDLIQCLNDSPYTLKDFYVLYFLGQTADHKLRLSDLQVEVGLSQSAMSRLIQRLEASGCGAIQRTFCAEDKRGVYIQLTSIGEDALRDLTQLSNQTLASYFKPEK